MILLGTIINITTVTIGSLTGYFFNSKLPPKILKLVFQGIGLFTIFVGINMTMKTNNFIILVFSIILGSAIGEWIDIERYIKQFSNWIKKKVKSNNESFSEGMITAFLLFCMGSMTILGAFEEGTNGNSELLIAKSLLDGFGALALASALGIGVFFSIIPLFIFQGGLTLLSFWLGNLMPESVINEMTAAGGLMLTGLGFSLLEIKKIKIINMLPALVFSIILAFFFA